MTTTLTAIPLPLNTVPPGYSWELRDASVRSTTTAFDTGLDGRDVFQAQPRCVVCGLAILLEHCHIIMQSEEPDDTWQDLKDRHWIPEQATKLPTHEPRNGLIMCSVHHRLFALYKFYIRYIPEARKFVLIDYWGYSPMAPYHGKAIALDTTHRHSPFSSLFIIHEIRVRAYNPFQPTLHDVATNPPWQDWILSGGMIDQAGSFIRDYMPSEDLSASQQTFLQFPTATAEAEGDTTSSSTRVIGQLNVDTIADILAATRAMPSWKACVMEGTSWDGTAEENVQRYISSVGLEEEVNDNEIAPAS